VLAAGIAGAVLLAVIGVLVRTGGPVELVDRAGRSFSAPLPSTGGDINRRLVSLSGNGRSEYWRVAWKEIASNPFLGGGAGSYERFWHRDRRTAYESRNAHNLYLETLAELGPIGLALLAAALGVPFVALPRARGRPAITAAIAAYTAFIVHAAIDWDWQILPVSLGALACAAAVLVSTRTEGSETTIPSRGRTAALVPLIALAAFAIVAEVGNSALARSVSAANRGQPALAERLARRAHRWAPWSAQPWQRLGEAQLAAGDLGGARRSFDHGVKLDRTDWSLWYDLAEASTGPARAAALAQASRLNPLSPEIAALRGGG
jgi:Flp pilus assembly protein TadD